jgi:hypothetical protein
MARPIARMPPISQAKQTSQPWPVLLNPSRPQGHLSETAASGTVEIEPPSNVIEQTPAIRPAIDLVVAHRTDQAPPPGTKVREQNFRHSGRRDFDADTYHPQLRAFGSRPRFSRATLEAPSGPPLRGVVKWFNPEKGFGFVELSDGSGDAFLRLLRWFGSRSQVGSAVVRGGTAKNVARTIATGRILKSR